MRGLNKNHIKCFDFSGIGKPNCILSQIFAVIESKIKIQDGHFSNSFPFDICILTTHFHVNARPRLNVPELDYFRRNTEYFPWFCFYIVKLLCTKSDCFTYSGLNAMRNFVLSVDVTLTLYMQGIKPKNLIPTLFL